VAGLDRRWAYQDQPPYTTPDCLNVRATEAITGRDRGGSRPGLDYAYYRLKVGGTDPVRLLYSLPVIESDGVVQHEDTFDGTTMSDWWTTPITGAANLCDVADGYAIGTASASPVTDDLGADLDYWITLGLFIVPKDGEHHGTYTIYMRLNDSTPAPTTDSITVTLALTGSTGAYAYTVTRYSSGSPTVVNSGSGTKSASMSGWFLVTQYSASTLAAYWRDTTLYAGSAGAPAGAGGRVGFNLGTDTDQRVDTCTVQYVTSGDDQTSKRTVLMASTAGELYRDQGVLGPWGMSQAAAGGSVQLASDRLLTAAARGNSLYIADVGYIKHAGTDGTISTATLDDTGGRDWRDPVIDTDDDVVELYNCTGPTAGVYAIASVAGDGSTVTLGSSPGNGTCSYRVTRGPKIYNHTADTLTAWMATTAGAVPVACPLVCTYRDRLVLAGGEITPTVWYMSRQGDPLDWDFTIDLDDYQRPMAGTTADAGQIALPIRALAPFSDDQLVFGCPHALYVLRGDPATGGVIDLVSQQIGIVDKHAWTYGPQSELIFMSYDGLYVLPPGADTVPVSLSRERIPEELLRLNPDQATIQLEYDSRHRGVHIFLTQTNYTGQYHYWYDWELKSFWPIAVPSADEPTAMVRHVSRSGLDADVILGTRSGTLKKFNAKHFSDGTTAISSHVVYGPFRPGGGDYSAGLVSEMIGTIGENGGEVDWAIKHGESSQAAVSGTTMASGSWAEQTHGGRQYTVRPRVRGGSLILRLANGDNYQPWSIERVSLVTRPLGKQRTS